MRDRARRSLSLLLASFIGLSPILSLPHAAAQTLGRGDVLLATMDDVALEDLLAAPAFLSLAQQGGAGLLVPMEPVDPLRDVRERFDVLGSVDGFLTVDLGSMTDGGAVSPDKLGAAAEELAAVLDGSTAETELVLLASGSPPAAAEVAGDHLGALLMAEGSPSDLAEAIRAGSTEAPVNTLVSDSTRRDGVVASPDLVRTAIAFTGLLVASDPGGEPIRVVDAPPPFELHERYVQSKRLTVPVGSAAVLFAGIASLLGVIVLFRRRAAPRLRRSSALLTMSIPFLALSLLLAGHLPSLTYATVLPFVVATTAIGTLALVPVARRWGTLAAVAVAGVILLVALIVEAALGWTAALTPLLGGSQLDGGRFFGLPNAFIGLLLGGSLYVAQRLPRVHGTLLIATAGLFAGSPWTGSNIGAAVTLFAAVGIWWGLRGGLAWWRTAIAAVAAIAAGTILVVIAHRYLTSAETHITTFSEHGGGIGGLREKFVDRLGVGADLITDNPFALLPVIGVVIMLMVVMRPPGPIRDSFEGSPVWRLALITIVVATVAAYFVNDSGAAAVGQGLTTSLAGMLYVSLRGGDGMMMTS